MFLASFCGDFVSVCVDFTPFVLISCVFVAILQFLGGNFAFYCFL